MQFLFLGAAMVEAMPSVSPSLFKRQTQDLQPNTLYRCDVGGIVKYGMLCPDDNSKICGFDGTLGSGQDANIKSYFPNGIDSATSANCNDRDTGNPIFMNWQPNTLYQCVEGGQLNGGYGMLCPNDNSKICGFDGTIGSGQDANINSHFPQGKSYATPAYCNNKDTGNPIFMNWQANTLYHCVEGGQLNGGYGMICPSDNSKICGFDGTSGSGQDANIKSRFPQGKSSATAAYCNNIETGNPIFMNWQPNTLYQCVEGGQLPNGFGMLCPDDNNKICGFRGDQVLSSYFPGGGSTATAAYCNNKETGELIASLNPNGFPITISGNLSPTTDAPY